MQNIDAQAFEALLGEVFETYDRKVPSAAAAKLWFDSLKEFLYHDVQAALRFWVRTKNKAPTIAEIASQLRDRTATRLEDKASAEKKQRDREFRQMPATEQGRAALALIKGILSKPILTPLEHCKKTLQTPGLHSTLYEGAILHIKKHDPHYFDEQKERVPGEDDEAVAA